ncbi:MAG: hypothetical protein M1813_008742 [Trichoglossum hirsutum]|nr:MAG: hypothetical protein M1813_008742 [Trichoglossum hirsutum]
MGNLAMVLDGKGKCDEAEEVNWRTLELRQRVLGNEHPNTLTSMNSLPILEIRGSGMVMGLQRSAWSLKVLGMDNLLEARSLQKPSKLNMTLMFVDSPRSGELPRTLSAVPGSLQYSVLHSTPTRNTNDVMQLEQVQRKGSGRSTDEA